MAAIDTPWIDSMAPTSYSQDGVSGTQPTAHDTGPSTVATFSPTNISGSSLTSRQRSTIIVHRKSPLLAATPPAVTRALAYSHPFLLPLNGLMGLLSWTSGDPWESFLVVCGFWTITLYGNVIILWAGPILVVAGLILGMYSRRYSPLSSTGLTGEKHGHQRELSEGSIRRHKTLDEIVETMRTFTTRCNILLEPLLELTNFLSTQRTATSATTRPALTTLLTRIMLVTPLWILLTLPPFYIITTRRVVLIVGTIILTWHSKPARISRVILWRSLTIRRICSVITGLSFSPIPQSNDPATSGDSSKRSFLFFRPFRSKPSNGHVAEISMKRRRADSSGVRFTFILYENQRRWLGIGWTYSLFAYERAAWTDEHLNAVPPKDEFQLPEVRGGNARWRWVPGSEWRIDSVASVSTGKPGKPKNEDAKAADDGGWIYYDNKWNDGRRQDGWGRYTRRRKWCRDAELVEATSSSETTPPPSPTTENQPSVSLSSSRTDQNANPDDNETGDDSKGSTSATASKTRKRRWFGSSDIGKLTSSSPPTATNAASSLPDTGSGAATSATGVELGTGKPPSISSARNSPFGGSVHTPSFDAGGSSGRNSVAARRLSRTGSIDAESLSRSLREKELEEAQNVVDHWGSRPGGAAERAEREWGVGDDAHMGLS